VNVLKFWLKAEAKDKRNIEDVRVAEGKLVQVCEAIIPKK